VFFYYSCRLTLLLSQRQLSLHVCFTVYSNVLTLHDVAYHCMCVHVQDAPPSDASTAGDTETSASASSSALAVVASIQPLARFKQLRECILRTVHIQLPR
jgi:hypothetical protein